MFISSCSVLRSQPPVDNQNSVRAECSRAHVVCVQYLAIPWEEERVNSRIKQSPATLAQQQLAMLDFLEKQVHVRIRQTRAGATVKNTAIPVQNSEISHHFAVVILKLQIIRRLPFPRKYKFVRFQTRITRCTNENRDNIGFCM